MVPMVNPRLYITELAPPSHHPELAAPELATPPRVGINSYMQCKKSNALLLSFGFGYGYCSGGGRGTTIAASKRNDHVYS